MKKSASYKTVFNMQLSTELLEAQRLDLQSEEVSPLVLAVNMMWLKVQDKAITLGISIDIL